MKEQEYKPILNRKKSKSEVKENFADVILLLTDITNYGSNLIPRCHVSSRKELEDAIILGVIFRQSLAMFDSLEILISNGSIYTASLQVRALFEAFLYLEWILKNDTKKKSQYYYIANLRRIRIWLLRTQTGSKEKIQFNDLMKKFKTDFERISKKFEKKDKRSLDAINKILSKGNFFEINNSFEKYIKNRKLKREPFWYEPLGIPSLWKLAEDLNRHDEYEMFYKHFSEAMHSSNYKSHIKIISKQKLVFEPLRSLQGINSLLTFAITIIHRIYRLLINHYRPGEIETFTRKYISDWRNIFLNIKSVKYNVEYLDI